VGERNSSNVIAQGAQPSQPAAGSATPQAAPAAGPLGEYTQATRYGDMLFVSGQIALDPRTGTLSADATIEGQTRQVMENVRSVLEANRLTMANVVSVTMYLSRINNLPAADRVYGTFFKGALPARSVVEVANLPRGALIEVSVVAGR
jgi:2-iminobutanoate/2-iminopropanoate deaminase